MANSHTLLYNTLDPAGGIRILALKSEPKSPDIECELISENLNQDPTFEALSYEWGPEGDLRTIKVNGVSVPVRQNLWWALWHLRKTGKGVRRIWIDALCINQDDDSERGHQVSMMGRIYRNATVICWLGRGESIAVAGCERAMKYLETISEPCGDESGSEEEIGNIADVEWFRNQRDPRDGFVISRGFRESLLSEEPSSIGLLEMFGGAHFDRKLTLKSDNETHLEQVQRNPKLQQESKLRIRLPPESSFRFRDIVSKQDLRIKDPIPLLRSNKSSIVYNEHDYASSKHDSLYADIESLCTHSYWRRTWVIQEVVLGKEIAFMKGNICVDGGALYLLAKSVLLSRINEESLLMLDAFRIFTLRIGRLLRADIPLIRLIEISEQSSCQDPKDKIFAMLGLASDCQNSELVPDYGKSKEDIYREALGRHSDQQDHDCWLVVHSSALLQRAFWPLSSSLTESEAVDAGRRNWAMFFKIGGLYVGSVASTEDPRPDDMMWWAHPGLVKPINSQLHPPCPQHQPLASSSYPRPSSNPWLWLSDLFRQLSFSLPLSSNAPARNPIQRLSLHPASYPTSSIYGPAEIQQGDVILRFLNSNITAILRRERNRYKLVGRGMVLNSQGDLDTFYEGRWALTPNLLRGGSKVEFWLSGEDLRSLTSPHY